MRFALFIAAALALTAGLPAAAKAAVTGYASSAVNLRAGPGTDFPALATIGAGRQLVIEGCIRGWSWCEVRWNGRRGWVSSSLISASYYSRRVNLANYGQRLGLPIVSFDQRSYWNRWYRDQDFFDARPTRGDYCPCPRRGGRWDRDDDDGRYDRYDGYDDRYND